MTILFFARRRDDCPAHRPRHIIRAIRPRPQPGSWTAMPSTASNLRELHQLHQRAKALRDRLNSGPKTLAARQTALDNRRAALEDSRKGLQDAKVQLKK